MNKVPAKSNFYEHISELRNRLIVSFAVFAVGASVGYALHDRIIQFINRSIDQPLYYQTPAGNFTYIMKVSVLTGLFVALPVLVYNLLRFIEPALGKHIKKRQLSSVAIISSCLAILGCIFAMEVVIPLSLHFFGGFKIEGVNALISADSYLTYVLNALISFMVLFQIPLVMLFINFVKPIPPKRLFKFEKYVIVGSLVIALLLPFTYDPVTQFVIAIPLVFLYNFSILLIWIANKSRKKPLPKAQPVRATAQPPRPVQQPKAGSQAPRPNRPPQKPKRVFDIVK